MSVEDIQKVNKLAQELLNQGFTEDRELAVKKAQEMLNKEITTANVQLNNPNDRQNVASTGDSEERLRNIIERTKEHVERQLNGYKTALIALEKEIRALKQEVATLKARPVQQASQVVPDPADEPQKVNEGPDPADEPQKVDDKESNPRTGSHKSDDVSIEKMFYFGNK